jgi:hypothetical protein
MIDDLQKPHGKQSKQKDRRTTFAEALDPKTPQNVPQPGVAGNL